MPRRPRGQRQLQHTNPHGSRGLRQLQSTNRRRPAGTTLGCNPQIAVAPGEKSSRGAQPPSPPGTTGVRVRESTSPRGDNAGCELTILAAPGDNGSWTMKIVGAPGLTRSCRIRTRRAPGTRRGRVTPERVAGRRNSRRGALPGAWVGGRDPAGPCASTRAPELFWAELQVRARLTLRNNPLPCFDLDQHHVLVREPIRPPDPLAAMDGAAELEALVGEGLEEEVGLVGASVSWALRFRGRRKNPGAIAAYLCSSRPATRAARNGDNLQTTLPMPRILPVEQPNRTW